MGDGNCTGDPILEGVVTSDGAIVIDRAQVTPLGVSPGRTSLSGRRIRSYLGSGDHLGPAPTASDFRVVRDEVWKGFAEDAVS